MKLHDLHAFNSKIDALEQEIECLLLQTDGRLLLTVPGLGVSTAAELYAEIGDVSQFSNANQLIKKAGTNPIIKQTGGGAGSYRKISKQGNDHLRYVVSAISYPASLSTLSARGAERAIFVACFSRFAICETSPFIACPDPLLESHKTIQLRYAH